MSTPNPTEQPTAPKALAATAGYDMSRITAKARVQLTVEVDAGAPWGADCPIGQLYKQAAESARIELSNALKPGEHGRVTIIGEPRVIGIITEKS